eukprot:gene7992-8190_t
MDTDEVVDQIGTASVRNGGGGGTAMQRKQVAQQLAKAAQVDQDRRLVDCLCRAPQFLVAAAHLLSRIWDDMPVDEVVQSLQDRGWDQATGGPPVSGEVVGGGHEGVMLAPNQSWGVFQGPVTAGPGGRAMRCAGLPPERTTSVGSGRTRRGNGRNECRMLRAACQRHRAFLGAAMVAGALLGFNDSRLSSKRAPSPLMRLHT